jgi:hypothetical protein
MSPGRELRWTALRGGRDGVESGEDSERVGLWRWVGREEAESANDLARGRPLDHDRKSFGRYGSPNRSWPL